MSKRTLQEAGLTYRLPESREESTKIKKQRKEKNGLKIPVNKTPASLAGDVESSRLKDMREEKRRFKKARASGSAAGGVGNGITQPPLEDKVFAVNAVRKAEKARLKALKQHRKPSSPNPARTDSLTSFITDQSTFDSSDPKPSVNSYSENVQLADLDGARIDKYLSENFVSIDDPITSDSKSLRPIIEFSYLPTMDPSQREAFSTFKAPTPIQAVAWPFLFAGRDVIGIAETGSGKTMAFALPCICHITSLDKTFTGAKAVVISPTRELAMQIYEQIQKLASVAGLRAVCVYGGVPKEEQRKALKLADIVVATPGRLNDLINEGAADLGQVRYVVLDEADRMLDKGFEVEIRKIINTTLPLAQRQTLMFTATWPESVRTLAATFTRSPVKISIGDNPTGDLRANARIVQNVEVVDPRDKEYRLLQLLKQYQSGSQKDDRILVFCLYKMEATRIEGFIRSKGIRVVGIHGDLSQEQRTRSLDAFKKGSVPVLVATDVAARGLDIPAVKLVINCTFPLTVEDYVHRIGRTGRAGKDGLAITLFTEHDKAQSGA
jgi:ATP-dependent RNA helicase DBP3